MVFDMMTNIQVDEDLRTLQQMLTIFDDTIKYTLKRYDEIMELAMSLTEDADDRDKFIASLKSRLTEYCKLRADISSMIHELGR